MTEILEYNKKLKVIIDCFFSLKKVWLRKKSILIGIYFLNYKKKLSQNFKCDGNITLFQTNHKEIIKNPSKNSEGIEKKGRLLVQV